MKLKLLITLSTTLFMSGFALGEVDWQREAIYALDFNGYAPDGGSGLSLHNVANPTFAGDTAIERTSTSGNLNYAADVFASSNPGSSYLYGHQLAGTSFVIADSNGIDGISADRGFTMTFSALNTTDFGWNNVLEFTYGGTDFTMQFMGTGGIAIYGDQELALSTTSIGGNKAWTSYGLSVKGNTMTLTAVNLAGESLSNTMTMPSLSADTDHLLTSVQGARTRNVSTTIIDNFALYNGTLEEKHLKLIAANSNSGNGVALHIPEPTTASLSMLALVGLLARRRRK